MNISKIAPVGSPATYERETYGQWLRRVPKSQLSRAEMRKLAEEAQWEKANPKIVEKLDLMVGRHVRLARDFKTFANDDFDVSVLPNVVRSTMRNPLSYSADSTYKVHARLGQYLLARALDGTVLQLRAEWVRLIPLPKNVLMLPKGGAQPSKPKRSRSKRIRPFSF